MFGLVVTERLSEVTRGLPFVILTSSPNLSGSSFIFVIVRAPAFFIFRNNTANLKVKFLSGMLSSSSPLPPKLRLPHRQPSSRRPSPLLTGEGSPPGLSFGWLSRVDVYSCLRMWSLWHLRCHSLTALSPKIWRWWMHFELFNKFLNKRSFLVYEAKFLSVFAFGFVDLCF